MNNNLYLFRGVLSIHLPLKESSEMAGLTNNVEIGATSPSFLQSVLAGSVEAEISDLHIEVKELEKNIQHLTVEVHEELTARYIDFDKFENHDGDYLQTAQKYLEDLQNISSRIADGQIKTDVEDSAQELMNLESALNQSKTKLMVIYQLLSIECALQTVKNSLKQKKYLDAASCYSKIPPMFEESENSLYQDLLDGLKEECTLQCQKLSFWLSSLWEDSLSWNAAKKPSKCGSKTATLKILKDQEMDISEIIMALHYVDFLESTLSMFGSSLLELVLVPILTEVTIVGRKDTDQESLLSVEFNLSKDKPSLRMVAANLKIVFDFLNEQVNVNLDSSDTCLSILGAFISHDFSKVLLKECLNTSMIKGQEEAFYQGLEELNELMEYISDTGFLHSDKLTVNVSEVVKLSANEPAVWECAAYLEEARLTLKKDVHETFDLEEGFHCVAHNGHAEGDTKTEVKDPTQASYALPACRIRLKIVKEKKREAYAREDALKEHSHEQNKFMLKLTKLFEEVWRGSAEKAEPDLKAFETARRIIEMYAGIAAMPRQNGDLPPSEIALFYNNSMFLAEKLKQLGFDQKNPESRKQSLADLLQNIRVMAVQALFGCLKAQRNKIVEKTRSIDLEYLMKSSTKLEQTVKECLLLAENLRTAWEGVLPDKVYSQAMGGVLNAWLPELVSIATSVGNIPSNIDRDVRVLYKVVADSVPALLGAPTDISSHVSRWSAFEKLTESRSLAVLNGI